MKRSVLSIENIVIKNRLMSLETIKKELKISKQAVNKRITKISNRVVDLFRNEK